MKVLHAIADMDIGGAQRVVYALAAASTQQGHTVGVMSAPGRWTPRLESLGVEIFDWPPARRSFSMTLASARHARRAIRAFRPTVVHAHNVRAAVGARLGQRPSRRCSMLTTIHGLALGDYGTAVRILRRTTPTVVACCPSVARSLLEAGMKREQVTIITNGVDVLDFVDPARRAAARNQFQIGNDFTILGVGRLVEQKNWPLFLEVATRFPHVKFIVAGDGPLREVLATSASNNVQFLGAVEDMQALFASVDVFLSTSDWEGMPLALLEAAASGVPAVATRVDGVADFIKSDSALLASPGDVDGLASAIASLHADEHLRSQLGMSARLAAANWTTDQMASAYLRLYEELGGRADSTARSGRRRPSPGAGGGSG